MSNLIYRLRSHDDPRLYFDADIIMTEAADALDAKDAEILRLKGMVDEIQAARYVVAQHNESLAQIARLKDLCDQLGNAMELHGSPFLHHELRYEEALTAWRNSK